MFFYTIESFFLLVEFTWSCKSHLPVPSVCILKYPVQFWEFGLFPLLLYRLWHLSCGTYCPALGVLGYLFFCTSNMSTSENNSSGGQGGKAKQVPNLLQGHVRTSFKDAKAVCSHPNSLLISPSPWRGNLLTVILQPGRI